MFLSRNKKNNVYPCKPQFYCIKVGFKGFKIIYACFRDVNKFGESGELFSFFLLSLSISFFLIPGAGLAFRDSCLH